MLLIPLLISSCLSTGKGIVHAQVPGRHPQNRHVQFWVNLPRECKHGEPSNQVLRAAKTPVIKQDGAILKLIAGEYGGERSPLVGATPIMLMDVYLPPNCKTTLKIPSDHFLGTYTLEGNGTIVTTEVASLSVTTSKATSAGDVLCMPCEAGPAGLRFLLYAGVPITQPVNVDGYFVCCTPQDTKEACEDFEKCQGAFARGKNWSSTLANK